MLYICTDKTKALREKYPNMEFFLVRIFLYSDWIRTRKNCVFGHVSHNEDHTIPNLKKFCELQFLFDKNPFYKNYGAQNRQKFKNILRIMLILKVPNLIRIWARFILHPLLRMSQEKFWICFFSPISFGNEQQLSKNYNSSLLSKSNAFT